MRASRAISLTLAIGLAAGGGPVAAEAPMSAIDWLSDSLRDAPLAGLLPSDPGLPGPRGSAGLREGGQHPGFVDDSILLPEPGGGVITETILVRPLDATTPDAAGLLSAADAGFGRDFWGDTPAADAAAALRAIDPAALPAVQALAITLLIAEFDPPPDSSARGSLFLARIDKLLEFGALEPALALIETVGTENPELFRRWFDIALLLGTEDRACAGLRRRPDLTPSYAAQVYCQARGGDWSAAALTLRTAEALALVSEAEVGLLTRFLDPEFETDEALPAAVLARPSPLMWRILEAIGEPLPTQGLPVAFAQAELRQTAGWRARIEAAERLARRGVLEPNRLLGLYTEGRASASGGVWDRVASVRALEAALDSGDAATIGLRLADAWTRMNEAELEVPFAQFLAPRLQGLNLEDGAARIAFKVGLIGPEPEAAASAYLAAYPSPRDGNEARLHFLAGLALGDPVRGVPPGDLGEAISEAFSMAPPARQEGIAPGPAVLAAMAELTEGARGDMRLVGQGLAGLRAAGQEHVARKAALQLLVSDRRG